MFNKETLSLLGSLLNTCRVEGYSDIYLVGTHDLKKTVATQQERASVIALALHQNMTEASNIAIIGAGFAGISSASTLLKLGHKVSVFEKAEYLIPLQHRCYDRFLHPNLYDWPSCDVDEQFDLAGIKWRAASAMDVKRQVERSFHSIVTEYIEVYNPRIATTIIDDFDEFQTDTGFSYTLRDSRKNAYEEYDAVLICIGFGLEISRPYSSSKVGYWGNSLFINKVGTRFNPNKILISGNGDGSLISVITCALQDFNPLEILNYFDELLTSEVINSVNTLEENIRKKLIDGSIEKLRIYEEYDSCFSGLVDDWREFIDSKKAHDFEVTFHSRSKGIFDANSSALNRFIVYVLWRCEAIILVNEELTEKMIKQDNRVEWTSENTVDYHRIEAWHGIDSQYFSSTFPSLEAKVEAKRNENIKLQLEKAIPSDVIDFLREL